MILPAPDPPPPASFPSALQAEVVPVATLPSSRPPDSVSEGGLFSCPPGPPAPPHDSPPVEAAPPSPLGPVPQLSPTTGQPPQAARHKRKNPSVAPHPLPFSTGRLPRPPPPEPPARPPTRIRLASGPAPRLPAAYFPLVPAPALQFPKAPSPSPSLTRSITSTGPVRATDHPAADPVLVGTGPSMGTRSRSRRTSLISSPASGLVPSSSPALSPLPVPPSVPAPPPTVTAFFANLSPGGHMTGDHLDGDCDITMMDSFPCNCPVNASIPQIDPPLAPPDPRQLPGPPLLA